jgi:hypothetical protein
VSREKERGPADPQREIRALTLLKIMETIETLKEADGWTQVRKVVGEMKLYTIKGRLQSLRTAKIHEYFDDLVQAGICEMRNYHELSEDSEGYIKVVKREYLEKFGKKRKDDSINFEFSPTS